MKKKLKDIANIQTGVFAKTVKDGEIVYLQAKHFDESGQLCADLHPDLKRGDVAGRHLLERGDILFAAKGTKNFAACYEGMEPAVASTTFFVIRINDGNILPTYLTWFLNQSNTQQILKASAIGTSIVSISKGVLEFIEVPIPDLNTQKLILKIADKRKEEIELKQKIELLREHYIMRGIMKALSEV